MAVDRIEVDEVHEDEPLGRVAHHLVQPIHAFGVARRVNGARDAAARKQIVDLADRDDRDLASREQIEQRFTGRIQRVVVPIRGSPEVERRSGERTRDDAADAKALADETERDFADAVLLVDRDDVFVRRDLEHAVGRRVDDRLAGPHVLGAQALDDLGARGDDVADRLAADPALELGDQIG